MGITSPKLVNFELQRVNAEFTSKEKVLPAEEAAS
jgi:hypothetical protein